MPSAKSPLRALSVVETGSVRRYAWVVYLIAMTGLALLYVFLKRTPFHSGPVFNVLGLSSVVAIVAAMWMHRAARPPWALIAAGAGRRRDLHGSSASDVA